MAYRFLRLAPINQTLPLLNGSNFDNVVLRTAYENCLIAPFWKFWNDRDVRTIVELGRNAGIDPKKDFPFVGEAHNALDDALHQVNYVVAIHQHLFKNLYSSTPSRK
ncbi:3'-5' exonuclease [Morganella morganii]|nr:3'-5' exoribonuclease [Morganella morganii]